MAPHATDDSEHSDGLQGVGARRPLFTVNSPNVVYTHDEIRSKYKYRTTAVFQGANGQYVATPKEVQYDFKVDRNVGKVGMMLVGWGGLAHPKPIRLDPMLTSSRKQWIDSHRRNNCESSRSYLGHTRGKASG